MSDWSVIVPEATVNLIAHPSVEAADISAFTVVNMAVLARSSAYSKWGAYSLSITPGGGPNNTGAYYQVTGAATTTYTFSVWVRGVVGDAYRIRLIDGLGVTLGTTTFTGTGDWQLVEVTGTTAVNVTVRCTLTKDVAGGVVFYADGWQLEQKGYRTTYCDGDREGCEWLGPPHAATSQRSALSRAGGRIRDLQDDYSLDVDGMEGVGMPVQQLSVDRYAILPGGQAGNVKTASREFVLTGHIHGVTSLDFHSKRGALLTLFESEAYPGSQSVRFRYAGAEVEKQISAYYVTGLEASILATDPCYREKVGLRFIAPDPFWHEVGESSQMLDAEDTLTVRIIAARLKSTGQWDGLGPPAAPGIAVYAQVRAIAIAKDGSVYVGGDFQNFNNNANGDYIVRWDPATATWSPLNTGLDGIVEAIAISPSGQVYIGGQFTDIGGGPGGTYNRIIRWDPVTSTWAALGAGLNNTVLSLAFAHNGDLYVGGWFTDLAGGGLANAHYVAKWNGAVWSALNVGLNHIVEVIAVAPDGQVYCGGNFNDVWGGPGATYNYIIRWDPVNSVWAALGSGLNGMVYALAVGGDNVVFVGGNFTDVFGGPGGTYNYVAQWNWSSWAALGSGTNGIVRALAIGPDGLLYAAGQFTAAGGLTFIERLAKWNGSAWAALDAEMPGLLTGLAIALGKSDPVIVENYDIFVGFTTTGTAKRAGKVTVMSEGTANEFPRIVVSRSGGTSARLLAIRNHTTGKELLFNYSLLDEETLTISLSPNKKSVVSGFFGPRPEAVLHNCDFGEFALQPEGNEITVFVNIVGAPTITAYMVWQDTYVGQD